MNPQAPGWNKGFYAAEGAAGGELDGDRKHLSNPLVRVTRNLLHGRAGNLLDLEHANFVIGKLKTGPKVLQRAAQWLLPCYPALHYHRIRFGCKFEARSIDSRGHRSCVRRCSSKCGSRLCRRGDAGFPADGRMIWRPRARSC
ncbi:uncharacterized protein LOC119276749 [Triticum dicoccoides]|uniref:uncharacterized protein LOC119276749 n=1 Tax=Triticum dicoccoides TaxID=85692 RepID=UPI000E7B6249|nr:uncharacterized protein LOC119276749 [Triticum dicoccoides]